MAGTHIPGEVNGEILGLQHLPRELLGEILHHLSLKSLLRFQCVNKNFCVAVDTLFSPFPLKVIHEILLRLPLKSLLRFKCVNKRWSDFINSPFFVRSHLERSLDYYNDTTKTALAFMNDTGIYLVDDLNHPGSQPTRLNWLQPYDLDYMSMRLVGSCNGLLCFKTCPSHDRSFYICNPSMRTFKEVVDPDPLSPPSDYVAGFGHDMENDDYKVVMVHIYGEDTFIYSLKADSWRRPTQKQHPKDCFDRFSDFTYYKSVFLNNRLHWVSRKDGCGGIQICAFDLCSEQWSTLQLPIDPCRAVRFNGAIQTGLSHGCLCLCLQGSSTVRVSPRSYITHSTTVDFWIMKEYGVQGSWHKLASVDDSLHHSLSIRPAFITYSEEGCKILFSSDDCSFANLVWYDSEQKTYTRFDLPGIEQFGADFVLCAESIVSITSSCKEE